MCEVCTERSELSLASARGGEVPWETEVVGMYKRTTWINAAGKQVRTPSIATNSGMVFACCENTRVGRGYGRDTSVLEFGSTYFAKVKVYGDRDQKRVERKKGKVMPVDGIVQSVAHRVLEPHEVDPEALAALQACFSSDEIREIKESLGIL